MTAELIHILQEVRAAVPHIDWQKLYEAAMLEMNPDKLAICIGAAEQAIAQQESSPTRAWQDVGCPFNAQEFE